MKWFNFIGSMALLVMAVATLTSAQTTVPQNPALSEGRSLIQKKEYGKAIQRLSAGLKDSPADLELQTELGKAYLYNRQDEQAMKTFNQVLAIDPDNKVANLELARALGYHRNYEASNRHYRRLLALDPGDEPASAGLVRNLIHQKKYSAARSELSPALKAHPESQRLQQLQKRIESHGATTEEGRRYTSRIQLSESFFSDSGGNRSFRSTQFAELSLTQHISTQLRGEEKRLWRATLPTSQTTWGTDEIKLRPTSYLGFGAGGGLVRFPDGSTRSLYRGAIEMRPRRTIFVTAGFGRASFAPTVQAAQLNLTSEGWLAHAEGAPGAWRFNADWSHQHFTDSNRSTREDAEILRWIGGRKFAVAAGYQYDHAHFSSTLNHGYFSPDRYNSNLGITGIRFRAMKHWSAEYLARVGGEEIDTVPWQTAFQVSVRNRFTYEAWEFDADYSYYHIAQSSGPFTAHLPRVILIRRF